MRKPVDHAAVFYNNFLRRALKAFVDADWHPFTGIEDRIRAAQRGTVEEKRELLETLPDMLSHSDHEHVRVLAGQIRGALVVEEL